MHICLRIQVFQPHPCWEVSASLEVFQEARQENGTEKQDD